MLQIAAHFARAASAITEQQPDEALMMIFKETRTLCEQAVAESSTEMRSLLANLQQPLETWQQVWSRLGEQQEFRQAVAREAELWSKRLSAMVKHTRTV